MTIFANVTIPTCGSPNGLANIFEKAALRKLRMAHVGGV